MPDLWTVLHEHPMTEAGSTTPLLNTYWTLPKRFLAGAHPGHVDEEVTKKRLLALLDADIRTFIDLTEEGEINEDAKVVLGYWGLLRDLAEDRRLEITYLRVPIPDRGVPSVWTMRRILDVVDRSLADENSVFVHCWAGRGRTGTVVGCFLKRHGLATEEDVIRKIAALRAQMPTGRESSPHTSAQVRMARNWKQST